MWSFSVGLIVSLYLHPFTLTFMIWKRRLTPPPKGWLLLETQPQGIWGSVSCSWKLWHDDWKGQPQTATVGLPATIFLSFLKSENFYQVWQILFSQANMGNMIQLTPTFPMSPKPALECFWHNWLDRELCFSLRWKATQVKSLNSIQFNSFLFI